MPQNCNFLKKTSFLGFRGNIADLRHLEGFLEKSEESRPSLKLKNSRSLFFSRILLSKDMVVRGQGPNPRITFGIVI